MSTPRAARSANAIAVVASKKLASSRSMCDRSCVVHSANAASLIGTSSTRSEEHTSELQSRPHLVCRLLLEKKKSSPQHYATKAVMEHEQSIASALPSSLG